MNPKYDIELPQSVIDSIARFLVPEIRKYYESEEDRKAFEKWQQENEKSYKNKREPRLLP